MLTVRPTFANKPLWRAKYSGALSTPGRAATVIDDLARAAVVDPVKGTWQPAARRLTATVAIAAETVRDRREGLRRETILAPAGPDLMTLLGNRCGRPTRPRQFGQLGQNGTQPQRHGVPYWRQ